MLIHKKRFWSIALLVQIALFYTLSKIGSAIYFFELLFEVQKEIHTKIFSLFPFSFGDTAYILLGIYILILMSGLSKPKKRKKSLLKFLITLNIFYFMYQIFWGMLYFQEPIINKLPEKQITTEELKQLSLKYLELCKKERERTKENTQGVFIIEDINALKLEIIELQKSLPKNIIDKKAIQSQSIKNSLYSPIMNYAGILGYYNPFSGEAQICSTQPDTYIPFTIAHEMAHQRGYAREQEAHFIAFLTGKEAKSASLRYSTYYFILKSLLKTLYDEHTDFVESVLESYSPAMKRDQAYELEFNAKYGGKAEDLFRKANDIFLKTNQQEGVITYSYFLELFIRYESEQ